MIVQLTGGLGNQMFGFAFGRSLAALRNEEVFFTRSQVDGNNHGGYALDSFVADIKFADKLTAPVYHEPHFQFDPNAVNAPPNASFMGYWQSEKYFNESLIRQDFQIRSDRVSSAVSEYSKEYFFNSPVAFIHVRRGDYLKEPHKSHHGNLSLDYYRDGIELIRGRQHDIKFLVFSDDPDWCEQNFPDFIIVRGTRPIDDLWLMSLCKHAVIANSSFSWWGAWLGGNNKDRIVVAPKKWFNADLDTSDLVPDRWVRI